MHVEEKQGMLNYASIRFQGLRVMPGGAKRGRGPGKPARRSRRKMTRDEALQWLAYVSQWPVEKVEEYGLTDEQLVWLGERMRGNKLLNPPKSPGAQTVKHGAFICKCCGELFEADYKTRKPEFKNSTHKMRYWRAKWREEGKLSGV